MFDEMRCCKIFLYLHAKNGLRLKLHNFRFKFRTLKAVILLFTNNRCLDNFLNYITDTTELILHVLISTNATSMVREFAKIAGPASTLTAATNASNLPSVPTVTYTESL